MNFISYCEECQLKRKKAKKGLVVEPIASNVKNSRCQVDLIDMQSEPDGNYKFIMVYQDHLTKFVQLRALEHKTAKQVAGELYKIFCTFGAPCILQSDNGREFANSVVSELLKRWPGCKMVHGQPRHSQSQGSVERANQDVRNMLVSWSQTKKSTHWAEALWDIQFSKNRSLHHGIRRSPYEAMFGQKPQVGLLTSFLPDDIVQSIETEEDLESAIDEFSMTSYESNVNDVNTLRSTDMDDVNNTTGDANDQVDQLQPMTINECDSCHEEKANGELEACKNCKLLIHSKPLCGYLDGNDVLCSLCRSEKRIADQRNGTKRKLEEQAEPMLVASRQRFEEAKVGQSVVVAIPDVDRGRLNSRNLLAVVLEVKDGFYKLGTKDGVLKRSYVRNELEICEQPHLNINDVPNTSEITLHEAAGLASVSGNTQGFTNVTVKRNVRQINVTVENRKCYVTVNVIVV